MRDTKRTTAISARVSGGGTEPKNPGVKVRPQTVTHATESNISGAKKEVGKELLDELRANAWRNGGYMLPDITVSLGQRAGAGAFVLSLS